MDDAADLMNPYEILEISPGATAEEIKAAYHRMAKVWHPDRYSGAEKEHAEKRFRELAEAFNALKDQGRRSQPAPPPPPPRDLASPPSPAPHAASKASPNERSPEDWFHEAEEAKAAGDLERALGLVQVALRGDSWKAEFHLFYAELLVEAGKDSRQAVRAFETTLRLNPKDVEAMIGLAELFQSLGMTQRSARLLQTAREISPNHKYFRKEARRAANLQSKEQISPAGLGGQVKSLFNRLFHRE